MKRILIGLLILALILSGISLFISLRITHEVRTGTIRASQISVERLALVDPQGTERLVLATGDKIPGPRLNQREFPKATRSGNITKPAGLLFYNSDGDEMGGMMWTGGKQKDGTYAQEFYFSLDPYWGNEMFSLDLQDDNGRRTGTIQFQEWPLTKDEFYSLLEKSAEAVRLRETDPQKAEELLEPMISKIKALRKEGKWPLRRFRIAMTPDGRVEMAMYDSRGKEKLTLGVDPSGQPYVHRTSTLSNP